MMRHCKTALALITLSFLLVGCQNDPSPALSPEDESSTFKLPPGLKIELVASEPLVQEPVVIKFDRKGRLWVVEMRGFMPDIDGNGEGEPIGRVTVLLDDNGDGKMDRSIVFADSLVLPRAIAFVEDGVLIAEDKPLWLYKDEDGDLVADQRVLIDSMYAKKGVVEHAPNGLIRGFDGWYYNAKSDHRYKKIDEQWKKDKTEFRGQWGISQDNIGRLYYNYNWSQLHADLVPPNYLNRNPFHTSTTGIDVGLTVDRSVFPIRSNLAANRGYLPETLDSEGKIKEFTSACSPFVYRGDLLPKEYMENVFVCEPVGNLIKRNIVAEESYNLTAEYAYDSTEFLASTDERFRPVGFTSGPDGAIYITDMYHGIIEHGLYMTEYLREVILDRKLEAPIHYGRIWRIVPEGYQPEPAIDLNALNTAALVELLEHKNGWYRDQAQQLLVEQKDDSAFDLLEAKIRDQHTSYITRIHALWTLFEMDYPEGDIYFLALADAHDQVKSLAIRLLENLVKNGKADISRYSNRMMAMAAQGSPIVDLQIALSADALQPSHYNQILASIVETHIDEPLIRDAVLSSISDREFDFLQSLITKGTWSGDDPGQAILVEMLASAITKRSDSKEVAKLLYFLNSPDGKIGWKQKAVLEGMSLYARENEPQSIKLSDAPSIFVKMELFEKTDQEKIKSIATMFDWPGKEVSIESKDTLQTSVDPAQYAYGRKQYLNICAGCHGEDGKGLNRFGPPLRNSEWVLGSEKRLALLLIHGMQGPVTVDGKEYGQPDILPEMPSFSVFDDSKIAAIMTYIRREWGHQASPVKGGTVAGYRIRGQGRLTPWTAEELLEVTD